MTSFKLPNISVTMFRCAETSESYSQSEHGDDDYYENDGDDVPYEYQSPMNRFSSKVR